MGIGWDPRIGQTFDPKTRTLSESEKTSAENASSSSKVASSAASVDDVALTRDARELQKLEEAVKNAPEINESRVRELKERIDNGTYAVEHERLAEVLLRMEHALNGARQR